MTRTRSSTGTLLSALIAVLTLGACGGASSATSDVLDAGASARAAAANAAATVSPLPGTPDASPTTQISFLGVGASTASVKVSDVHAVGSRSGSHGGQPAPLFERHR